MTIITIDSVLQQFPSAQTTDSEDNYEDVDDEVGNDDAKNLEDQERRTLSLVELKPILQRDLEAEKDAKGADTAVVEKIANAARQGQSSKLHYEVEIVK